MGNGKHTGSMTTIDYTTITSCWANCVYGQYAGNFVFTNSLLKDSGGAAIHIEDGTSKADQPCGSYVLIDENTIVENFVSGTEGYFKAYSMEIIAMMLKGSIDGSVAGITSMDPRIPSYTLIREITDPVTGLPTEKMNFVILFKTCGENDKATAVQNGYAYQNRINLYLPYYSFTNAAVGNIVPSDTLGNYYNTSYLYAAEDKSNSYAQSTGLMMKTNYNGIDGSQGMFLFENHQTGPSWLIGLGLDPVSTQ